jgi:hypothetical protein
VGSLLASDLITRCATALFDTNNAMWSQAELLTYLNEGTREIAVSQPTSTQLISTMPLVAGARQKLPPPAWLLFDVLRNMGQNGTTPGQAIRIIERRLLDTFSLTWMAGPTSSVVSSYFFDLRDQTGFFVYPPNDGTGFIEINYSQVPPPITAAQPTAVTDALDVALFNYMMFRACSKKAEYAAGPTVAAQYLALFNAALGLKAASEQASNPNASLLPATANKLQGET